VNLHAEAGRRIAARSALIAGVGVAVWLLVQAFAVESGPAVAQYETPVPTDIVVICHVEGATRTTMQLTGVEARAHLDAHVNDRLGPCSPVATVPQPPNTGSGQSAPDITTPWIAWPAFLIVTGLLAIGWDVAQRRARK
jgi:hypothetical protein